MRSFKEIPRWVYISVAFVVFQILDGILTCVGIQVCGSEIEANPIAMNTFLQLGLYQGAIFWKIISLSIFFSLLWYCLKIHWSTMDVIGLLYGREPKRDIVHSMKCFNRGMVLITLVSFYASGGWAYALIYFKFMA